MLTENVHYEHLEVREGKLIYPSDGGPAWGYCYRNKDGCAKVLRITHPDIDSSDLIRHGDFLNRKEMAQNATYSKHKKIQ